MWDDDILKLSSMEYSGTPHGENYIEFHQTQTAQLFTQFPWISLYKLKKS